MSDLVTPLIRQSFESASWSMGDDLNKWRDGKIASLGNVRAATAGGEKALALLQRGRIETPDEYADRQKRFRNVPLCGFGAATHAWLLYGMGSQSRYWLTDQPIPDVLSQVFAKLRTTQNGNGNGNNGSQEAVNDFADSQAINEWFRDVHDANYWPQLSVQAAYNRVRDGLAVVKIWPRFMEDMENLGQMDLPGMGLLNCEDAQPSYHPEDPSTLMAVAEARLVLENGKWIIRWRLWTADRWDWIHPDFAVSQAGEEHAFGTPPFAFLGDGKSMLNDAYLDQRELIHRESIRLTITQSQGFSYFQMNGEPITKREEADPFSGPSGNYGTGPNRSFWFKNENGGISFANPEAPLDEHRIASQDMLINAMRMSLMLPGDLVSNSMGPEQPTAIAYHWIISKIAYGGLVREAVAFQDQITQILEPLAVSGNFEGLSSFEVGDLDWEHVFRENPLPTDAQTDRDRDRSDVTSGFMHPAHYVSKWILPNADPDEIVAYWKETEARKKANTEQFADNGNVPRFGRLAGVGNGR